MPLAGHTLERVAQQSLEFEPDPITRSRNVLDTSTSLESASALARAPMSGCLTLLRHSGRADQRPAEF